MQIINQQSINNIIFMDFGSAITTEGLLEKQSPNVFKLYQSRYFAIRGKGEYLVWFKKKPVNPDKDPQGIININAITQVLESQQQPKMFSVIYLERTFNLRAQSIAIKQRWVNSLKTLMSHHQKINKKKIEPVQNTVQSWKWNSNTNQSISELIRIENEQAILQDTQSQKLKQSEQLLAAITKQKNLFEIQKCIVYGFFQKKRLLLGSSQRWFFLASGVNLKDDKDEEMYTTTEQLLEEINGPEPQKAKQDEKKKKKYDSSSDEQQQQQEKNVEKKKDTSKRLRINTLFEFEAQTKQLKHTYNLIDIVSFEMKSNEQPFELKITYQEVINEEEEEIKENQIILTNVFLIEIKKLYNAIKTVNEKYNMQKQRQEKNANKSKRYPAKRWKNLSEDSWRAPEQKASLYVLLNRKMMRINMLTINLQQITSNSKQSIVIAVASTNNEDGANKQKQKKQDVLRIKYKKQKQEIQIYIQFDKVETMTKFSKKLGKNIKKIQEEIQNENNAKVFVKKEEEKQQGTNQDTYFIEKKIRQTNGSIKLNFYEMMDREVILQKKQEDPNKNNGFFSKFKAMLCAAQIGMINDASS